MSIGQAIAADTERYTRLNVRMPVTEARLISEAAKRHGTTRDPFIRRVLATWLVAMEDVDPRSIPSLSRGGLLR